MRVGRPVRRQASSSSQVPSTFERNVPSGSAQRVLDDGLRREVEDRVDLVLGQHALEQAAVADVAEHGDAARAVAARLEQGVGHEVADERDDARALAPAARGRATSRGGPCRPSRAPVGPARSRSCRPPRAARAPLVEGLRDVVERRGVETGVAPDPEAAGRHEVGDLEAADDAVLDAAIGGLPEQVAARTRAASRSRARRGSGSGRAARSRRPAAPSARSRTSSARSARVASGSTNRSS